MAALFKMGWLAISLLLLIGSANSSGCTISPSSASLFYGETKEFSITCSAGDCSSVLSEPFTIETPHSFSARLIIPYGKFSLTTSPTGQGEDSGIVKAKATAENGSAVECTANVSITDTKNITCSLYDLWLSKGVTTTEEVQCFECIAGQCRPVFGGCQEAVSKPFAWVIKPNSNGISLTPLDNYNTEVEITATEDVGEDRIIEASSRDIDNNLVSCSATIHQYRERVEKCMVMPISYSLLSQTPSVTYGTRCVDPSGLIKECDKGHSIRAIGLSSQSSQQITLPLVELNKRPIGGYLIVAEDGECSSYFHPIIAAPLPNLKFKPQCTKDEDCSKGKCIDGLCRFEQCSIKPIERGSVKFCYEQEGCTPTIHSSTMDKFLMVPLFYTIKGDKVYILEVGGGPQSRIGVMDISDPANPKLLYQTSLLSCGDSKTMVGMSSVSNDNKIAFFNRCGNHIMIYDTSSFRECAGALLGLIVRPEIVKLQSGRYIFGDLFYLSANDEAIQDMEKIGIDYDYCRPTSIFSSSGGPTSSSPKTESPGAIDIKRPPYGMVRAFEYNGRTYLLALAYSNSRNDPDADGAIGLYDITDFSPFSNSPHLGIIKIFDKKEFKMVATTASAVRDGKIYVMAQKQQGDYGYRLYVFDMNGNELAGSLDYWDSIPYLLSVDSKYAYVSFISSIPIKIIELETMKTIPLPDRFAQHAVQEGYTPSITYYLIGREKNNKHYFLVPIFYKNNDGTLFSTVYTSFELVEECIYI
ncbi:MAG: hypothetical protein QW035_03015 [Candidatus Anstonellales archaeon]